MKLSAALLRPLAVFVLVSLAGLAQSPSQPTPRLHLAQFGKLPLAFVPAADGKAFAAQGPGYTLTLRADQATLALGPDRRFQLQLEGAHDAAPRGTGRMASVSNEYFGNDRSLWRTGIPNYGEVDFRQIYPGIGLRYYGQQGQLEADFLLAPGANPARIRLSFPGTFRPSLDAAGVLRIGAVTVGRPSAYQIIHGQRRAVSARYVLRGRRATIRLGAYDHSRTLVIDPTLSYSYNAPGGFSTLTGLARTFGLYMEPDGGPVLVAAGGDSCGDVRDALDMYCTVAIWKFNSAGTQVLWRSSIAGPGGEYEFASGTDPKGDIFVGGSTDSPTGFPTTSGVVQETPSGPGIRSYVAKFGPDGTLLYSTLLGTGDMELYAVTGDANGDAFVAGSDKVSDLDVPPINNLPAPCGGSTGNCYNGFVEELNATATDYLYGTYFGGPGLADSSGAPYYLIIGTIAVDAQGHIYIGGQNIGFPDLPTVNAFESTCQPDRSEACLTGFVAEINPAIGGTGGLMFSDYLLGFPSALLPDQASPPNLYVAGDGSNDPAFVTQHPLGLTNSLFVDKIPTATPAQPAFQTLFDGDGGGTATELGSVGLALDGAGDIWVGGVTGTTSNAAAPPFALMNPIAFTCPSGTASQPYCITGFVSEASPDGASLLFSTYLGGSSTYPGDSVAAVAADASGNVYAAGTAASSDFPVTPNAYYSQPGGAFLTKLAPQPAPTAPTVSISPRAFPTSFDGTEVVTQIVVTNTATSGPSLVVGNVTYSDPSDDYNVYPEIPGSDGNPPCYYYDSYTPDPVPPGGSCDISVYWYPEGISADPLTVSIFDNAANSLIPQVVNYNPTAYNGAQATIAPPQPIGNVLEGSQAVATVTVTNTGNAALTIDGFNLTGSADFTLGTALPTACTINLVVNRGSACNIAVVYTANGTPNVAESTTLTVFDNATSAPPVSPQTVQISATTTPPEAQISPNFNSLQFPTTAQGAPSETLSITFQNVGTAPLNIGSVGSEGAEYADFHVQSNCVTQSPLQVYSSCTASVYFQPSSTGPEGANLEVVSNDPLNPVLLLPLSGNGAPGIGPPTSLPFLVSVDNSAPPDPLNGSSNTSAVNSGGQFVAFTTQPSYGMTFNGPGPGGSASGVAGLYLRNTCNGPNAGANCTQSTQFIAYGPTSGPASNGGLACINQQSTITNGASNPEISADGRYVAFNDDACPVNTGGYQEPTPAVFLRDLQANDGAGTTTAVTDASGNPLFGFYSMSRDARYFAYPTPPTNPGAPEIYVTDTAAPQTVLASQSNNGTSDAGTYLSLPSLSPDGRYVAFASDFDDVNGVAGGGSIEVYLRDTCLGAPSGCQPKTILVSADSTGAPAAGGESGTDTTQNGSSNPGIAVSAGGRYVVFTSQASSLPQPSASNGTYPVEVYLRDTLLGTTSLLSSAAGNTAPSGDSAAPRISDDGRIITFYNGGQLLGTAPYDALYSYDTCESNGQPVNSTPTCVPGLRGVVSADSGGPQSTAPGSTSLDPTGQFVTYRGPANGCTSCTPIWENTTGAVGVTGVTVPLVSLTASNNSPGPGAQFTYTITAANTGTTAASDVTVTDSLPSNGAFVGATSPCVQQSGVITCDFGPLAAGGQVSATITVTAPNSPGAVLTDSATLSTGNDTNLASQTTLTNTITLPSPPSISTSSLPDAVAGQSYSQSIATSGGAPPVTVNLVQGFHLPPGLSLSASTVSGTPTTSGNYPFSVYATDSSGFNSLTQSLSINVDCPAINIAAHGPIQEPVLATAGQGLTLPNFTAVLPSGNALGVVLNATGNLDGLTFNSATGILSGIPSTPGSFEIGIGASGGGCSAAPYALTLDVSSPASITVPVVYETVHVSDNPLGSPNSLISANIIPPVTESINVSDALGSPSTLISAQVIPTVNESISVTDSPAPSACAVAAAGIAIQQYGVTYPFIGTTATQRVTLTNTGSTVISRPILYVLDGLQNATLQAPAGVTTCAVPSGSPYIVAASSLAPGAQVTLTLKFTVVPHQGLSYTARVLTGGTP